MPMHMNHVQCSGEEVDLLQCMYSMNLTDNDHSKDVGVKCGESKLHCRIWMCID